MVPWYHLLGLLKRLMRGFGKNLRQPVLPKSHVISLVVNDVEDRECYILTDLFRELFVQSFTPQREV